MNKKKALVGPVLSLIFAIALSVTAGFAWFSIDKSSILGNINLNVASSKVLRSDIKTYAVREVEMVDNEPVSFTLATEGNELVLLTDMPMYETLSEDNSLFKYKPVLAVKITFVLREEAQCLLNVLTQNGFTYSNINWLSNSILFSLAEYDDETNELSIGQPLSFVNLVEDEPQKVKNINIINGTFEQGEHSIWIILQYKHEIIESIHDENSAADVIEYRNDIIFELI